MESKNILIVFAHQEQRSFNGALKDVALETLRGQGHEVTVSDLYEMRFDPTASRHAFPEADLKATFDFTAQLKLGLESDTLPEDLQAEVDKILAADLVVLQFPIYWLGLPAILKGWVDRCMEVFFEPDAHLTFENSRLADKKLVLSLTTGHHENCYSNTGVSGDMDVILWPIQNALRKPGFQILAPQISYCPALKTASEREDMLNKWKTRLPNILNEEPIRFIHINNFNASEFDKLSEAFMSNYDNELSPNPGQNMGRAFQAGCMTGQQNSVRKDK